MDLNVLLLVLAYTTRCLCAFVSTPTSTTSNATERHRLYTDLFVNQGYNSKIQPFTNRLEMFDVHMTFVLKTIINLDEITETLKTSSYMVIQWHDAFLKWNRTDYDYLYLTYWPQNDVWKPDIILANSVRPYGSLGGETLMIENYYDGLIRWYPLE
ncbi:acetylcholine receptor subunit alpha-type acr-16-like, partial [Ruditapes philippinarum]|uniref:acetylcholine receptor subunit alpha-type acr-16-like n=1 Tax=Ruditapes philippinarum TaxID=129788 RepID=UPI00295C1887